MPGVGGKTQTKVLMGVENMKSSQGQYYYAETLDRARGLLDALKSNRLVEQAALTGGLRRRKEVVNDIDLVAASGNRAEVIGHFCHLPGITEIVAQGETHAAIRLDGGIQADLRVVRPEEYPYALRHFTGSKEHNAALGRLAQEKGFRLNEQGLFMGDEKIICNSEEELFRKLGLCYIPPELRENNGEIEAAQHGELPILVKNEDIQGVLHIHSNYSDGDHSPEEMVIAAIDAGFKYIGFSDHSQSAYYAHGLKEPDLRRQRGELEKLRGLYPQIAIFSGIESDIKADGSLDYPDSVLRDFDFVVASVHSHFKMPEEEMTKRMVRAMSHPAVTILAHPTGRILLARKGYAVNIQRLLEAAREYGVIMELNASPARLDLDWRYLKQAREMGLKISINPDAHRIREITDVYYGVAVARKGWLTREDVFNCMDADSIRSYFINRKNQQGNN